MFRDVNKKVGFFYNEIFLEHETGAGHPESPHRLAAIKQAVDSAPFADDLVRIDHFPARAPGSLHAVHEPSYVEWVKRQVESGVAFLDFGDTHVCEKSYAAALSAADAATDAAHRVWHGELDRAFVAPRPPGHHAEAGRAMGFCIFNNIAVAAAWLLSEGAERLAILDWDVHHGNGTQAAFYSNPGVLFVSLHQSPHYPGTGSAGERGAGDAVGTTLNIPMSPGSGDDEYLDAFNNEILPALDDYEPQMILISAGFDAHVADPLSAIRLSTEVYGEMTRLLCAAAKRHSRGRIASILEGGYALDAVSEAVVLHLQRLVDEP